MRRKGRAVMLLAVVAAALVTGCGEAGSTPRAATPTRAQFTERLAEREGLSHDEAACVTRYAFAEYDADAIVDLYDGGLQAVTMAEWNSYGHAMVACTMAKELGVPLPPDRTAEASHSG